MEKTLNGLIEDFQKGDTNQFLLIAEKFNPVIKKYARRLYKDSKEDTISELTLSLLEAVHKIRYLDNEKQCSKFLITALNNRFYELYRISKGKYDHELQSDIFYEDYSFCYEFNEVEVKEDLQRYLSDYSSKQREILISILIKGKTNTEVALEFHVSRQYTNRIKNKLCKEMKEKYIA